MFTRYNNPNKKKLRRRIDRSTADILAAKAMVDDLNLGINRGFKYYDKLSDKMCGKPSRNIY